MKRVLRSLAISICFIAAASTPTAAEETPAPTPTSEASPTALPTPVTVGVLLPLTGDFAFFGEQARQGIEVALAELSRDGEQVRVIFEDEKCLPKAAVEGFKKLVTVDKVDQILGPVCTGSILSVAESAKALQRHFLALLDANRPIAQSGEFTYAMGYSSEDEAEIVAEHIRLSGFVRVGIIYEEDAWAIGVKDAFKAKLEAIGGSVVAEESQVVLSAASAPDYRPVITKVMKHTPDALFVVPAYNGGFFLKQLRSLGKKLPVFGPDTFAITDVIEIARDAAEGVVCANALVDESTPGALRLQSILTKKLGHAPSSIFYPGLGYDGLNFVVAAARSGKPFPEAIASLDRTGSVLVLPAFNADRQSKLSPVLFTIKNQKIQQLAQPTPTK
jgi:branched-chain amino acid transport system substrate-binding protein